MRTAPLSVLFSATLLASSAFAQDTATVNEIEAEISTKQAEFEKHTLVLQQQLELEKQLQKQLESLQGKAARLEQKRNQSLDMMNEMYRRFVDDPTLDLADSQAKYQQSVEEFKQNKRDVTLQLDAIASQSQEIERLHLVQKDTREALSALQNRLANARVARLYNEFRREGTLEVIHTVNCQRTDTLAGCEKRGQQQALQKASNRFLDQIFDNLSERRLIEAKRSQSDAYVKILSSHVVESSFSGQGNYNVNLSVSMQGDVSGSRLCGLLELDNLFCADYGTAMSSSYPSSYPVNTNQTSYGDLTLNPQHNDVVSVDTLKKSSITDYETTPVTKPAGQDVAKTYQLTLRSNVKGDEAWIDGVSYGPTRLTVTLPAGVHDIEVRKQGYQSYQVRLDLAKSQTIHAKLVKKTESIAEPTHQSEQEFNYLSGHKNADENEGIEPEFDVTPFDVTFADYLDYFSIYGAGDGGDCRYHIPALPVWQSASNWRSLWMPGQGRQAAICLTASDADGFVVWLSEETGRRYRIANETNWHIPMQVKGRVSPQRVAFVSLATQSWRRLLRGQGTEQQTGARFADESSRFRLYAQLI